ncbi:hypothetical protein MK489_12555 [Myxococcota bacterium]|nr:hypothetical protein [Myxococcota bacterium]
MDGIVFVREQDGDFDLWRSRMSDGAEERMMRTPGVNERRPLWSDAAKKLLFEAWDGNRAELVLLDPVDGSRKVIRSEPNRRHRFWADWAPDGKHFTYTVKSPFGNGTRGVREYDVLEGKDALIGSAQYSLEHFRSDYAPDSRRVVSQRRGGAEFRRGGRDIQQQLWMLERGKRPREITGSMTRWDHDARFTRDGKWIVFAGHIEGYRQRLNVIRTDGTDRRPLAYHRLGNDGSPAPSPTRDEVVFTSYRNMNAPDLFLVDLDGENLRTLTESYLLDEKVPQWSPDGERILVKVTDRREQTHQKTERVRVIDREGQVLLDVVGDEGSWMPPW